MNDPVKRENNGRFLPGFTANPSGRPKVVGEIRELARQHAPAAFTRVCELVQSQDPRIALAAAQEILNRAYGRPVQAIESEVRKVDMGALWLEATKRVNEEARAAEQAKVIEGNAVEAQQPGLAQVEW